MLAEIKINKIAIQKSASLPFITATDLADYLVSNHKYSFRKAHHAVGNLVKEAEGLGCDLRDLPLKSFKKIEPELNEKVLKVLSVDNSIKSRVSFGGTAPSQVKLRILDWRKKLM